MNEQPHHRRRSYHVLPSFVTPEEAAGIVSEALSCHEVNGDLNDLAYDTVRTSTASVTLALGISSVRSGPNDISPSLPRASTVARRAFRQVYEIVKGGCNCSIASCDIESLQKLSDCATTPLTGLALIYGAQASMPAHYDSPTQPGQRNEWLCMMSMGLPVRFRCDDEILTIYSRDVLVMDAMATRHGVESVVVDEEEAVMANDSTGEWRNVGLPFPCRLGVLFWQGRSPSINNSFHETVDEIDGMGELFAQDDDD